MSEPIVYTQREYAGPLISKEVTTTYEEILRDFDDPCLVRSLVDRCLVLERELAEARDESHAREDAAYRKGYRSGEYNASNGDRFDGNDDEDDAVARWIKRGRI